jgi:hypothetical protein
MLKSALNGAKRAAAEATARGIKMAAKAVASKGVHNRQPMSFDDVIEEIENPKIIGFNELKVPLVKKLSPDFMRVRIFFLL